MQITENFSDFTIVDFMTSASSSVGLPASAPVTNGITTEVALGAICPQHTQSRANVNDETVAEYAELLAAGVTLPPITVFNDGDNYWIGDGFHRYHAAVSTGAETIFCMVYEGGRRDALRYSLGANTSHGLRRTNEDKRYAVELALDDEEWGQWSSRAIADLCGVSDKFVGRVRAEYQVRTNRTSTSDMPEMRRGRDGKEHPATKTSRPCRISGGPTFDIAEIEAAPPRKPPKNGSSVVDGMALETARTHLSGLVRDAKKLDLFDEFNGCLSGMLRRLNQLRQSYRSEPVPQADLTLELEPQPESAFPF
jgi:hypothetical protein